MFATSSAKIDEVGREIRMYGTVTRVIIKCKKSVVGFSSPNPRMDGLCKFLGAWVGPAREELFGSFG